MQSEHANIVGIVYHHVPQESNFEKSICSIHTKELCFVENRDPKNVKANCINVLINHSDVNVNFISVQVIQMYRRNLRGQPGKDHCFVCTLSATVS